MKTAPLRQHALALGLIASATAMFGVGSFPAPAHAQARAARAAAPAPEIYALQINADSGVASGSQLQFMVEGTPRSQVRAAIANNAINVALKETARGVYRGTYTVRRADNIDPTSVIRVSLASGQRTAVMNYTYPPSFIAAASPPPVAQPPVAQAPAAPLEIERFIAVAVERVEPGTVLQYRLVGAPGAQASFSIPGLADRIEMRETRPGRYEGSYTVRRSDNLDRLNSAVATLRAGNRVVTADLDRMRVRDNDAPTIVQMVPRQGDSVPPGVVTVGARFEDAGGRGVDPRSVRIVISGRDLTNDSRITPNDFAFRGPLPPGRHTVEVTAQDRAGNSTAKSWTFEVGTAMGSAPYVPLQFLSPSNNAAIDGGQVTIQGRAAPGALVRIKVDAVTPPQNGRMAVAQPVLSQTVQADVNGNFSFNFGQPRVMPVPGTRYEVSAETVHGGQSSESRIVLFQRG
jgi:hypothetical protein